MKYPLARGHFLVVLQQVPVDRYRNADLVVTAITGNDGWDDASARVFGKGGIVCYNLVGSVCLSLSKKVG